MRRFIIGVIGVIIVLICGLYLFSTIQSKDSDETSYYQISNNDLIINVIRAKPSNIVLTTARQEGNIMAGGLYGINGGYFAPMNAELPGPLCIAINDHVPIREPEVRGHSADPYQNTGWYNAWGNKGGTGTIVYDKVSDELKLLCLKSGYDIPDHVTDTKKYWAQGGIDFAIGKTNWLEIMQMQGLSRYLEAVTTYRSAMGIKDGFVFLFTTEGQSNLKDFRNAIENHLGESAEAVLLDGYLCSQMLAVTKDGEVFDQSRDYVIEEIIGIINWDADQ